MADQRILRNTSATLTRTFYVDGTATSADGNVTLGITDEAGAEIVAAGTVAVNDSTGVYSYLLAPQSQLNRLTVTWSGTWSAVAQSFTDYVEVVGGHLFTEAEARAAHSSLLTSATVYPDAAIAEARDRISDEFEQFCGVSFVPRYNYETIPGSGNHWLPIERGRVSTVIAATVNSTSLTVANVTPHPTLPKLHYTGTWSSPTGSNPLNVTVEYEHGYDTPPPDIKRAALILLRHQIIPDQAGGAIPDRAISLTDEVGTIRLAQPGFRGAPYGIPLVDQTLMRYTTQIPVS